ncbi:MAG: hypothetical protein ACLQJ0_27690 [Steroidobacteraceae bacterium]
MIDRALIDAFEGSVMMLVVNESVPEIPSPERPDPNPFPDQTPHDVPDPGPQAAGRQPAPHVRRFEVRRH